MLFSRREGAKEAQSSSLQCYFCLQTTVFSSSDPVPPRPNPSPVKVDKFARSTSYQQAGFKWKCDRCGCWNGWDDRGETLSFHSQMQDPSLNAESFQKRATYPSTTLPISTLSSKSPFCSSCTANHMIVINILANYLPDEADPGYEDLLGALPAYEKRLYERYPPVCERCEVIAEEEIRKGDYRAKTSALNGFLVNTSTVASSRTVKPGSLTPNPSEVLDSSKFSRSRGPSFALMKLWELKRILWMLSEGINLTIPLTFISPTIYQIIRSRVINPADLPPFLISAGAIFSILWIAWDPMWKGRVKARSTAVPTKLTPGGRLRRKRWVQTMLALYPIRIISGLIVDFGSREISGNRPTERAAQIAKCWMGLHLVVELFVLLFFMYLINLTPVRPPRPINLTRTEPPSGPARKHQHLGSSDLSADMKTRDDSQTRSTFGPTSSSPSSVDVFGRPHHPLFGSGSFPAWPASAPSFAGLGSSSDTGPGRAPFSSSHDTSRGGDIDGGLMDWQPTLSPSRSGKGTYMEVDKVRVDGREKDAKKKTKKGERNSAFVIKKSVFDRTPSNSAAAAGSDGEVSDEEGEEEEQEEEEDTTWLGFNRAPRVFPSSSRQGNSSGNGNGLDAAGGLERLFEGWSIGEEYVPMRKTQSGSSDWSDGPRPRGLGRLVRSFFGRG